MSPDLKQCSGNAQVLCSNVKPLTIEKLGKMDIELAKNIFLILKNGQILAGPLIFLGVFLILAVLTALLELCLNGRKRKENESACV